MAKRTKISLLFFPLAAGALIIGLYLLFQDMQAPEITISHGEDVVSPSLSITVAATDERSAVRRLAAVVRFQENVIPVAVQEFEGNDKSAQIRFTLEAAGLKNNDVFDLEITAQDASLAATLLGFKNTIILPMKLDAVPPRMSVKASVPYVRRGGSACTVYSINKEVRQTGVKVGDYFFPAFRRDTGDYLCFFAFPYTMETREYTPQLAALDKAGNLQLTNLPVTRINRPFKTDTITISQGFLDAKAAEFETIYPGMMSDLERFLIINGQVRRQNALTLLDVGKNTASDILWKGAFERLPRAASRAGFADFRTYLWEGEKVDEQTHLGFDLASTKNAPVPAANNGTVVYVGHLGIYGNLVVIDHGLGLQSLYSHLSEISVQTGQTVKKNDIIGKTGATGMAGGDHLHFGILIAGLEVTPLEWLDSHWIKDNIIERIKEAGVPIPEFNE